MWSAQLQSHWQKAKWFFGCGGLAILFYDNVGFIHTVRGKSMSPTLNPGPTRAMLREKVWLSRLPFYQPRLGDIIVFKSPKHGSRLAMKRVTGVAGDSVVPSKVMKADLAPVLIKHGHVWVEAGNAMLFILTVLVMKYLVLWSLLASTCWFHRCRISELMKLNIILFILSWSSDYYTF